MAVACSSSASTAHDSIVSSLVGTVRHGALSDTGSCQAQGTVRHGAPSDTRHRLERATARHGAPSSTGHRQARGTVRHGAPSGTGTATRSKIKVTILRLKMPVQMVIIGNVYNLTQLRLKHLQLIIHYSIEIKS